MQAKERQQSILNFFSRSSAQEPKLPSSLQSTPPLSRAISNSSDSTAISSVSSVNYHSNTTTVEDELPVFRSKRKRRRIDSDSEDEESLGPDATPSETPKSMQKSYNYSSRVELPRSATPSKTPSKTFSKNNSLTDWTPTKSQKFKQENEERYSWLQNPRDSENRDPSDPEYDPRTLYIPSKAWHLMKPFEKQFWDIKRKCWDTILFFQKGKFYELYENDADLGHQLFDLKLTDRVNMRMVGVPESAFEHWASQFVAKGYKVARVDQMETALGKEMNERVQKSTEKVVRRELVQLVTSGTAVDEKMIGSDMAIYCMAIKEIEDMTTNTIKFGISWVDTSTGNFQNCHFTDDESRSQLCTLILQVRPKELLLEKGQISKCTLTTLKKNVGSCVLWTFLTSPNEFWNTEYTLDYFSKKNYFESGSKTAKVFEAICKHEESLMALGALASYLQYLKIDEGLISIGNLNIYDLDRRSTCLTLDGQVLSNLEIFTNSEGTEEGTLFDLLCRCATPFGKRQFKLWLCYPLRSINEINKRLDAIDNIRNSSFDIRTFRQIFSKLPDIERMSSRVHAKRCKPREFVRLLEGLKTVSIGLDMIRKSNDWDAELLQSILSSVPDFSGLMIYWKESFDWEKARAQNILQPIPGFDAAFDKSIQSEQSIISELEQLIVNYRKKYNCRDLSFKAVGKEIYQVDVPKSLRSKIPDNWVRLSGTTKTDRYWPPEVKKLVRSLLEKQELKNQLLKDLEAKFYGTYDQEFPTWQAIIRAVCDIDCLMSLADVSLSMGRCCRPNLVDEERAVISLKDLWHPCLNLKNNQEFIPNDVLLGGDEPSMVLLTGPNMAGKSTLLRQVSIAVIMAQIGCYVPASEAHLTPIDRIFTRLGANDNIFNAQSTFMVELLDTKKILENATTKSLVILDELGRGTSTYDGMAIAHSVLYHLATFVGPIGFFSTHYTALAEDFRSHPEISLKNMSALVDDNMRTVTFLYKLVNGVCLSSHGMNVAAMAGIPHCIIEVAEKKAAQFTRDANSTQTALNTCNASEIIDKTNFKWLKNLATQCQDITATPSIKHGVRLLLKLN